MIIGETHQDCVNYADTIDFLEAEITRELREANCDLATAAPESVRSIDLNVGKVIKEYEAYIDRIIIENPYFLKEKKENRDSKQFWVNWRKEQLKPYLGGCNGIDS